MKKTRRNLTAVLALLLTLAMLFSMAACNTNSDPTQAPTDPSTSSSVNSSNPTDPNPTDPQPTDPQPTDPQPTDPAGPSDLKITVTPPEMEIYAGEEIDLMFGVTVNNSDASLIISDDSDFDQDTPGEYVITYKATLDGNSVTATRTITVLQPLSALALEVRTNYLGQTKWEGNLIRFTHQLFVELNADADLPAQSGVFHNTSDKAITLSVGGGYGSAAIIDKNGVVLEGRDGANSKLVNAENPVRTSSSATTMMIGGESVTVSSAFAKEMVIPAGGYAIVIQTSYAGTTADTDGRGFMNYNVIYAVGNVVRLYWVDDNTTLTNYANQKPEVSGNTKILAQYGDVNFDLDTLILAGIVAKDDNGTFATSDDVALQDFVIIDRGGFDINKAGVYTIHLSVSDGSLTTEFTREVEVKMDGIGVVAVGDVKFNVDMDKVAINQDLSSVGTYAFIIYNGAYEGELNFANGHGEAFVVNKYGEIVRIYDGANGKYYDAANKDGKLGGCVPTEYAKEAFASLQEGETLIIAPNSSANNPEGGSRWFLNKNKVIGAKMTVVGLKFEEGSAPVDPVDPPVDPVDPPVDPPVENGLTLNIADKTITVEEGKWAYNADIAAADAGKYGFLIYDKSYTGTVSINGYGAAIVLDQYGTLIKIYDGANVGFWTAEGKAASAHFTAANYATVAFEELEEGQILVIAPHDGGSNPTRGFLLGLRNAPSGPSECGKTASLTGFTFEEQAAE